MGNWFNFFVYDVPVCGICLENFYILPHLYSLNCGHIFCDKCLIGTKPKGHNLLRCPKCRSVEMISFYLPRNFKCENCKKNIFCLHNKCVIIYLIECDHYFCNACIHIIPHLELAFCSKCKKPKEYLRLFF